MSKPNAVTYICFVRDHSGSMSGNKEISKNNFNEQIAMLKKDDDDSMESLVTVIEFDDDVHCLTDNCPLNLIVDLKDYWIGGTTALYDSIAMGIKNVEKKMADDPRTNKAAILVIQTDGQENASKEYKGEEGRIAINNKINKLEKTKLWSFTFLGSGIDNEVEAAAMTIGIKAGNIMANDGSHKGMTHAYQVSQGGLGDYMQARKRGATQTMSFYDDKPQDVTLPDQLQPDKKTGDKGGG